MSYPPIENMEEKTMAEIAAEWGISVRAAQTRMRKMGIPARLGGRPWTQSRICRRSTVVLFGFLLADLKRRKARG